MKLKVTLLALSLVAILGLCVVFVPESNQAEAGVDVSSTVINQVNSEIGSVGFKKKEELAKQDATALASQKAREELDPFIKEQQAELERLLEEYYDAKLNSLLTEAELESLKQRIVTIRESIYTRYTADIDKLFK